MGKRGDIARKRKAGRRPLRREPSQRSNLAVELTVTDDLAGLPVSEDEIAVVEAFLGLQGATILSEDTPPLSKAIGGRHA
jgi:hypothetical protein